MGARRTSATGRTTVRERCLRIASNPQHREHGLGRPQGRSASQTLPEGRIRKRLTSIAEHLGCDELAVLTLIADRLLLGRQQFGDLAVETDTRDFTREALEEAADMAVYAAAGLLRTEPGVKAINTRKRRR